MKYELILDKSVDRVFLQFGSTTGRKIYICFCDTKNNKIVSKESLVCLSRISLDAGVYFYCIDFYEEIIEKIKVFLVKEML